MDLYGIGIVLYEMMVGEVPFQGRNIEETMEMIKKGNIEFPKDAEVSKEAKGLIRGLMGRDEESRLGSKGWDEIKGH